MSHNNFNKNLINCLVGNFNLTKNILLTSTSEEKNISGNTTIIVHAKQTFTDIPACKCCNNSKPKVVRNGTKTVTIKHLRIFNYNCSIKLSKQRFICKHCKKSFTIDESTFIKRRARISNDTKLAIALELKNKLSLKDIARLFDVSINTVVRVFNDYYSSSFKNKNSLSEVLSIDEFKSTKDSDGSMSCILLDGKSKKIFDIIEDRKLESLVDYTASYSLEERKKVKHVVIDMYSPYVSLVNKMFPEAKISIDRFHIVQHVNRALNQTRVSFMNTLKTKDPSLYKKYKRYWKLILKDSNKLSEVATYQTYSYRKYISEAKIVEELLSYSEELDTTYTIYQNILYGISSKNYIFLESSVFNNKELLEKVSNKMKIAIKSLKKYSDYIENAVTYEYSNGAIEGMNNKIKVLKRVSFGYRRFDNFKKRILICNGLLNIKIPSAS